MPTTKCMADRVMRWTCCDKRDEGIRMNNGCCARFHIGPSTDPQYAVVMAEVEARDKIESEYLDDQIGRVKRRDMPSKARRQHFKTFKSIADDLVEERKIVARYENLPKEVSDSGHG